MNLFFSVVNPFPPEGISLYHYIDYVKDVCPLRIKRSDRIVIEDGCINVYRVK